MIYQATATDLDDPAGGITYGLFQVASKFSKDKFSVDPLNGRVTLKNSLDYEQLDEHVITIKASETASRGAYGRCISSYVHLNQLINQSSNQSINQSQHFLQ